MCSYLLNLSPSAILEEALSKAVKVAKYEKWWQENKQAIVAHNRKIEEQGTFSENIATVSKKQLKTVAGNDLKHCRNEINAGIDLLIDGF